MPESGTLPIPDPGRSADPPRDEPPASPGLHGHPAHIESHPPAWLRVPAKAAGIGMGAGLAFVSAMAVPATVGFLSADTVTPYSVLSVALGAAWAALTYRLLRSLGKRRPLLTGQLHAALLVVPGMFALAGWDYAAVKNPVFWGMAAIFSGLIGLMLSETYGLSVRSFIVMEPGRHED